MMALKTQPAYVHGSKKTRNAHMINKSQFTSRKSQMATALGNAFALGGLSEVLLYTTDCAKLRPWNHLVQ